MRQDLLPTSVLRGHKRERSALVHGDELVRDVAVRLLVVARANPREDARLREEAFILRRVGDACYRLVCKRQELPIDKGDVALEVLVANRALYQ